MTTVTFDTLKFVKTLTAADFPDHQAEALSNALKEAQETRLEELATKADLHREIASAKVEIIKWVVATAGVVIAAIKLIPAL